MNKKAIRLQSVRKEADHVKNVLTAVYFKLSSFLMASETVAALKSITTLETAVRDAELSQNLSKSLFSLGSLQKSSKPQNIASKAPTLKEEKLSKQSNDVICRNKRAEFADHMLRSRDVKHRHSNTISATSLTKLGKVSPHTDFKGKSFQAESLVDSILDDKETTEDWENMLRNKEERQFHLTRIIPYLNK